MPTTKTLVEIEHDTGYGDQLISHLNIALRGKDMRANRIVATVECNHNWRDITTIKSWEETNGGKKMMCLNCGVTKTLDGKDKP